MFLKLIDLSTLGLIGWSTFMFLKLIDLIYSGTVGGWPSGIDRHFCQSQSASNQLLFGRDLLIAIRHPKDIDRGPDTVDLMMILN